MKTEIQPIIDDLRASVKDAPQQVKAYLAERCLIIAEAFVTFDPGLNDIVRREGANIKGMAAVVATDKADAFDAAAMAVFDKAIGVGIAALMNM
jgi:hypothetical protein